MSRLYWSVLFFHKSINSLDRVNSIGLKDQKGLRNIYVLILIITTFSVITLTINYWSGFLNLFNPNVETIEITSYHVQKETPGWIIYLNLHNGGSKYATLLRVSINKTSILPVNYGKQSYVDNATSTDLFHSGITLKSGDSTTIRVWIDEDYLNIISGSTILMTIRSNNNLDYVKYIVLFFYD